MNVSPQKKIWWVAWLLWAGVAGVAGATEVSYVPARAYAAVAEREIEGARESVEVYLYLFVEAPNQGPGRLARALARARRRGVRVEVLLERGLHAAAPQNEAVGAFLAREGATVAYVDDVVLHAKGLVVDGRTVLAGSTNWSSSALERGRKKLFSRFKKASK